MEKLAWCTLGGLFQKVWPERRPERIVGIKSHGHPLCLVRNTRQVTAR